MDFKITARYVGDDYVELTHENTGSKIMTDLPPDNGGRGRTFSPTDLFAAANASCVLSIMQKFAAREGINFIGSSIEIQKIMSENPRRVAKFILDVKLPKGITELQREKLLACVKACPVGRSLHPEIAVEVHAD